MSLLKRKTGFEAEQQQTANLEPMRKVRIKKAAEIVAGQIRNAIIRGEIRDGDSLPAEMQLIATFAVSRPTIREAIRILESENLITVSRGARGGALVRRPVTELSARALGVTLQARNVTLRDVYEARALFEPICAHLAADKNQREKSVAILRDQIARERSLLSNRPLLASAMAEFHTLLAAQSGNNTLMLIAQALHSVVEKHNSLVYRDSRFESAEFLNKRAQVGLRSQARLVDLIEAGNSQAAEEHWRKHMAKTAEFWLSGAASSATLNVLD